MEVIRRCYVWALRVNVSDPSPWVTVFGPFECHEKPYANIVQKGMIRVRGERCPRLTAYFFPVRVGMRLA